MGPKWDSEHYPMTEWCARQAFYADCKRIRTRLGISQEQFSEEFRLPLLRVQAWEAGMEHPTYAYCLYLQAIAAWAPPGGWDVDRSVHLQYEIGDA